MKLPSRCQHLLVLAGSCVVLEGVLIHKRDLYSCVFMDMGFALQNLACIRIYYPKPISRIVLFWLSLNLFTRILILSCGGANSNLDRFYHFNRVGC